MKNYIVLQLGEIIKKDGYSLNKIEEVLKKFSCQREVDLENFLIHKAIPYDKTDYGKTYLLIDNEDLDKGEFTVLAYFTVAQKSLEIGSLGKKKKRKVLGEYPGRDGINSVPAFLIGQLGRSDICSKLDLPGEQILFECYHAISLAAKVIGGKLLVLECREHMFEKFYAKHDFKKLYDELNQEGLYTLYKKVDFSEYWINS